MRWWVLLLVPLSGCTLTMPDCASLAELAPTEPLPLLGWATMDPDRAAHALAAAMDDEITAARREPDGPPGTYVWSTREGNVTMTSLPGGAKLGYWAREAHWSSLDEARRDLEGLLDRSGAPEDLRVSETGSRGTDSWTVLEQYVAGRPSGLTASVSIGHDIQQVALEAMRDASAVRAEDVLPDDVLTRQAEGHTACHEDFGHVTGIHASAPDDAWVLPEGRLGVKVPLAFDDWCGREDSVVVLDARSGALLGAPSSSCE